jgi:hypothetical protein
MSTVAALGRCAFSTAIIGEAGEPQKAKSPDLRGLQGISC